METIRPEAVADGQAPLSSVEVVSKVILPDSSNSTFFKNAGLATYSLKTPSAAEQALPTIHEEFVEIRKRSEAAEEALARTQQLYEDMKKRQEENNLVLQRIL
ncbi:hypothetical protein PVAP13_8KG207900 [Panicum virgatum]|uniref:Uncharacterized protein n=1 Tax=Panicum virgatum TaxID=38727 RepID=A0A8T0PL33_PANVG|nr:hypothetical protein PVAP13_8KG207900 [Panicum virgatum]